MEVQRRKEGVASERKLNDESRLDERTEEKAGGPGKDCCEPPWEEKLSSAMLVVGGRKGGGEREEAQLLANAWSNEQGSTSEIKRVEDLRPRGRFSRVLTKRRGVEIHEISVSSSSMY